jgi:hypothetical protein
VWNRSRFAEALRRVLVSLEPILCDTEIVLHGGIAAGCERLLKRLVSLGVAARPVEPVATAGITQTRAAGR